MAGRAAGQVAAVVAVVGLAVLSAPGQSPPAAEPPSIVVHDLTGKEIKVARPRLTAGTRRLGWLADPKGDTDDAKKGPLALEVREPNSTTYQKGIVTLIPLASVESIKFDNEKQSMAVGVKGLKVPVEGTLQYKGINTVGLDGDAGGVPAAFTSAVPTKGAKTVRLKAVMFPDARPLPSRSAGGTAWAVQIDQPKAMNPTLVVRNLKALYAFPGGVEQRADTLPVRKGEPLPLNGTLRRLEPLAVDLNAHMAALEVEVGTGPERVVIVPLTRDDGGKTGTLIGLVGEVDAGWKLFPLHTVKTIRPAESK